MNCSFGFSFAISAILANFASICDLPPCVVNVSLLRTMICNRLSSADITRYHRYYAVIRLPTHHLTFSLFIGCLSYSLTKERAGSPELLCNHCIACLALRPRGSPTPLAVTLSRMLSSSVSNPSTFPVYSFRGSITFRPTI